MGWQWSNAPSHSDRAVLAGVLGTLIDKRGGHAWGYATASGDIIKGTGTLGQNVHAKDLACHMTILVHTRFATVGGHSKDNAHPFKIGKIIGAHNGAVYNHHILKTQHERDYEVDSMHIFGHINDRKPLNDLEGYGAIEFFHADYPGRVFLGRFDGELTVAKIPGRGIVWASQRDQLEIACKMAHLEPSFLQVKNGRLYAVEKGILWKTSNRIQIRTTRSSSWSRSGCDYTSPYARTTSYTKPKAKEELPLPLADVMAETVVGGVVTRQLRKSDNCWWVKQNGIWVREAVEKDGDETSDVPKTKKTYKMVPIGTPKAPVALPAPEKDPTATIDAELIEKFHVEEDPFITAPGEEIGARDDEEDDINTVDALNATSEALAEGLTQLAANDGHYED